MTRVPTLTPLPNSKNRRRSLDGTWQFTDGPATGFPTADLSALPPTSDWDEIPVPAEWSHVGHEINGDRAWYRRTFEVPEAWGDERVKLRFGAVYSLAEVWVNGQPIGSHEGGYTPFEFDVTGPVDPRATNTVTVAVAEESTAHEMAWGSGRGGITRNVTLFSVPPCHVTDLRVETTVSDAESEIGTDKQGKGVTTESQIRIHTTIRNAGDYPIDDPRLTAHVAGEDEVVCEREGASENEDASEIEEPGESDGNDEDNGVVTTERNVGFLAPGDSVETTLSLTSDAFEAWTPADPTLYDIVCELDADGDTRYRVGERVGIRDVSLDGTELLVNGKSVTLRGVNWEEVHPDHGQSVPPELTRADAERLREANVNFVRTAHHPPSEAFIEACDELGLLVEVEAPFFQRRDDAVTDAGVVVQQTCETVSRDCNHPSVVLWSLANESDWTVTDGFETAAMAVSDLDPTRPTVFHWDQWKPGQDDIDDGDVRNHHYPATRPGYAVEAFESLDAPIFFGEFAHTYCYNDRELTTDPGLRDDWGRVFAKTWEQVRDVDAAIGGAIWAGGDHVQPTEYRWGILDRFRRRRPEFWHVKKTYSPVAVIETERNERGLELTLADRSTFTTITDRPVRWTTDNDSGTVTPDTNDGEVGSVVVPAMPDERVDVSVYDPRGFHVDTFAFEPKPPTTPEFGGRVKNGVTTGEDTVAVEGGTLAATVHRASGDIRVTEGVDASHVLTNGGVTDTLLDGVGVALTPAVVGRSPPAYDETLEHRPAGRQPEDVVATDDAVTLSIAYDDAEGSVTIRPVEQGLRIEYACTVTAETPLREAGLRLSLPPEFEKFSWLRSARWSHYPDDHVGRPMGSAVAFPDGDRPETAAATLSLDRPWRHDVTKHGSNDFRSTKRDARAVSFTDGTTHLGIQPDDTAHVRAQVRDDVVDLLLLDHSVGGVGLDFLDRLQLLEESTTIAAGTQFSGAVTLGLRNTAIET